jgi:hypothetical protein
LRNVDALTLASSRIAAFAEFGPKERMDRTQEVAGSSPAYRLRVTPAKRLQGR